MEKAVDGIYEISSKPTEKSLQSKNFMTACGNGTPSTGRKRKYIFSEQSIMI